MKQQIEKLIERLASKKKIMKFPKVCKCGKVGLSSWTNCDSGVVFKKCGECGTKYYNKTRITYKKEPILIDSILERIKSVAPYPYANELDEFNHWADRYYKWLHKYWGDIGFTKSLQEIFEECEWIAEDPNDSLNVVAYLIIPKQKAHRELFLFLLSLNL